MLLPAVYPILDSASLDRLNFRAVEAAEAFLEGGAQILQFRHKGFWGRDVFAESRQIAVLCNEAKVPFVVNDRSDFAALLDAGVHLGQNDLSPADARKVIGPERTVGFSTHNTKQVIAAQDEPVDYVAFGPIFPTLSKEHPDPLAGIENLRTARGLTRKPLVAIGGISRDNASNCWQAGANSVAVIADLLPHPCTKQTLRERMTEWRQLK